MLYLILFFLNNIFLLNFMPLSLCKFFGNKLTFWPKKVNFSKDKKVKKVMRKSWKSQKTNIFVFWLRTFQLFSFTPDFFLEKQTMSRNRQCAGNACQASKPIWPIIDDQW